jgi:Uma2 family endonuclease
MALMSLPITGEILNAVNHLPAGASLVVPEVSWDDYERFLHELGNRGSLRVSYDSGLLQIMSISFRHATCEKVFDRLISEYARVRKIEVEMSGNVTWKRKALAKGVEADGTYFIQNVKDVIGLDVPDTETVPPPDIAVEIDITNSSLRKLSIYAALGVREIWRCDGRTLQILELNEGRYVDIDESRFLPDLTRSLLAEYLQLTKSIGQTKAVAKISRRLSRTR